MSRFHESDGEDPSCQLWPYTVARTLKGKKGQKVMRDFVAALLSLPERKLCADYVAKADGTVCANGAIARYRGLDLTPYMDDPNLQGYETEQIAQKVGVQRVLAWEMGHRNDVTYYYLTDAERAEVWAARKAAEIGTFGGLDISLGGHLRWRLDVDDFITDEMRWNVLYRWAVSNVRWELPVAA